VVKEFHTIYDTFSALDKEYIQGIINSLSAAEKANEKALEGIKGVRDNQQNIEKIINQQKQVINVLKNFKENIEKIKHIHKVDELYATFTPIPNHIETIESSIEIQEQSIGQLETETSNLQHLLEKLQKSTDDNLMSIKQHIVNDKNEMEDKQASLRIDLEKVSELSAGNYTSLSNQLHTIDGQMKEIALKHGATIDELEKSFDHRLNEMHTSIEDKQASLQTDLKKLSEVSDENHKSLNDQLHTIDGQM